MLLILIFILTFGRVELGSPNQGGYGYELLSSYDDDSELGNYDFIGEYDIGGGNYGDYEDITGEQGDYLIPNQITPEISPDSMKPMIERIYLVEELINDIMTSGSFDTVIFLNDEFGMDIINEFKFLKSGNFSVPMLFLDINIIPNTHLRQIDQTEETCPPSKKKILESETLKGIKEMVAKDNKVPVYLHLINPSKVEGLNDKADDLRKFHEKSNVIAVAVQPLSKFFHFEITPMRNFLLLNSVVHSEKKTYDVYESTHRKLFGN